MKRKLPIAEVVVALAVFAAGAVVYAWAHRDEADIDRTRMQGSDIVQALERYRSDEGSYPASLDALVPAYLADIPQPAWGEEWTYRTFSDGAHCELYVRPAESALTLRYDFSARGWAMDRL